MVRIFVFESSRAVSRRSRQVRKALAKSQILSFQRCLFFSQISMNRGSLDTKSLRCMHLSVSRYRLSNGGFAGPKSFRVFQETGPLKATETFRAVKPFLAHLNLKLEICIRLKLLVWREPLFIFSNMWIKQPCNHKVWYFAAAFRVRTFEKCGAQGAVSVSGFFVGSLLTSRVFLKVVLLRFLHF